MKKYFYLTAVTAMMLVGCTNESFIGEDPTPEVQPEVQPTEAPIAIGGKGSAFTRASFVGADAAALLNKKFIVEGTKTVAGTPKEVFDDFLVKWEANTAGVSSDANTSDWDYVGVTAVAPSDIAGTTQAIKYWDYEATQYDFAAYSTGTATVVTDPTAYIAGTNVLVSAIDYNNLSTAAYTIKASAADLAKVYVADLVTAYKDGTDPNNVYQQEITFTFRNLASKARVGIYETVPGYSVKDVKFYTVDGGATPSDLGTATATNATLFTTGSTAADNFFTSGQYTVKFPTIGKSNFSKSDYNKAHVEFAADGTQTTTMEFGALNYGGKEYTEKVGTQFLGRNSAQASFAGTSPYWATVLPNETGTVLELRVDYTLESIDGTGEEIHVYGATALVPVTYTQWQSNYAYTYLFKISDATNGWTSQVPTDPKGLYPITFDAVVADAVEGAEQTTITTVATPSITTYQKGHLYTDGPEYSAAKGNIYVQVMAGSAPANDLATKGQLYTMAAEATEAEVLSALNLRAIDGSAADIVGRNGVKLDEATSDATITAVPGVNGNNITVAAGTAAEFTPSAGYYAYVYTVAAPSGTPETLTTAVQITAGFNFDDAKTANANDVYYLEEDCSGTPVTGTAAADKVYYQKYLKNNGQYAVKVIKVGA